MGSGWMKFARMSGKRFPGVEMNGTPGGSVARMPVAVVGANGYSGEELCRILAGHPGVSLHAVTSRQWAGRPVAEVLPRLAGHPGIAGLEFSAPDIAVLRGAEVVFLALPHGLAAEFAVPLVDAGKRVVDLSADFRLRSAERFREFYGEEHGAPGLLGQAAYGIPELRGEEVAGARLVASAGCYPTSILLPLVPLMRQHLLLPASIVIASASGVSGAGRKVDATLLFGECNESLRSYGLPKHRHLSEIEQELAEAAGVDVTITFVPHLAPMTRGIHTTIFAEPAGGAGAEDIAGCLRDFYAEAPFVRVGEALPDTKNVSGTNFCDLAVRFDVRTGRVILLSVIDNLVKGAAGQAVQNFNLMSGFPETEGLI
jgi:N-acetyl-gamma-glutamyl-phosphate reductase